MSPLTGLLALCAALLPPQAAEEGPLQDLLSAQRARNAAIESSISASQAEQARADSNRADLLAETDSLLDRAEQLEERLVTVGRTRATGILMRRTYDAIPGASVLRAAARERQERIAAVDLRLVLHETEVERLKDLDAEIDRLLLASGPEPASEQDAAAAREELREILVARLPLLERGILPADRTLRDRLLGEDAAGRALATLSEVLRASIRGQLVWVRSSSLEETRGPAATRLLSPTTWPSMAIAPAAAGADLLGPAALLLLVLVLFAARPRLRKRVVASGQRVGRYRTDSTLETLLVAGAELLRAAPVPLLLIAAARWLELGGDHTGAAGAAAHGLREAAALLLPLVWLHHACCSDGLLRRHFRWNRDGIVALRRGLRWLTPFLVTATGVMTALDRADAGLHTGGVARIAFAVAQLATTVFLYRTLSPTGPLLQPVLNETPNGWLARTRVLWAPLRVVLPGFAALLAVADWTFGAEVLASGTFRTLALAAVIATATSFLHRWRRVERRRIAVNEALRRQEARRREAEEAGESASEIPAVEEDKVDLPAIDAQTRQLFRTSTVLAGFLGLYSIWAVALPVLGVLDRVEIWPTPRVVAERVDLLPAPLEELVETTPIPRVEREGDPVLPPNSPMRMLDTSGSTAPDPSHGSAVVTLQQVIVGLLFLLGTFVIVRNLTGLLEILLLRLTNMPADGRLAVSSLARYTLSVMGMVLAFRAVGIAWSQVQWLAAALTFGLAFGLQEIFANFVSGLIILLERPVRIGDTVTVGNVTGTVSRIRTRATTITDWDRKELLVPNKSFITDQVVNWSLSDAVVRETIEVGVAYGSDVDLVTRLLLEAARSVDHVLEDPAPRAVFAGFGDNSLLFKVRVFIPDIEFLFDVRSGVHHAVLRSFRKAGVEISFPQRDLHIRSWAPEAAFPAGKPGAVDAPPDSRS